MNGTRIIWRILVWLAGILSVIMVVPVIIMMIQVTFASLIGIAVFVIVVIGFPLAAHLERSKR